MASTQSDAARERARSLYFEKLKSWESPEELLVTVPEMDEESRQRTAGREAAHDLKRGSKV